MQTHPTHAIDRSVDPEELDREIAARTARQAELWAALIAGATQKDLYLADIAAAGLEVQLVQRNPGYRFTSERAQRTGEKYGAISISLLALNPNPIQT